MPSKNYTLTPEGVCAAAADGRLKAVGPRGVAVLVVAVARRHSGAPVGKCAELADLLGVSAMTVRRGLADLRRVGIELRGM